MCAGIPNEYARELLIRAVKGDKEAKKLVREIETDTGQPLKERRGYAAHVYSETARRVEELVTV